MTHFIWLHWSSCFCRPHLFDYSDQLDRTPIDCCENAFSVAEQFLDVDRLLEPSGTNTAFIICSWQNQVSTGLRWPMKSNFYNCVSVFVFWKLTCTWTNERSWNVSLTLFPFASRRESVIYTCPCKNLSYIHTSLSDVVRDRPDKKSILMYVSNLYNKLAPGVTHMTVQRNGTSTSTSRKIEKSEHTHTVSKRTISSTYHTEHTVKHVKKGYDEREPVRYVTTTSTTVKEPPIQHSAITTVVSLLFSYICPTPP